MINTLRNVFLLKTKKQLILFNSLTVEIENFRFWGTLQY